MACTLKAHGTASDNTEQYHVKLQEPDCVMSPAGGLAAAVGSAVCNGSFGTISRLDKVQRAQIPFPIFNFWTCAGIVISSLAALAATPRVFTPFGLLSGLLFVLSMANTFFAIQRLGLGSAAGVWCGVSVIVSFTFAVKFQGETISSPALAAPGLMLLVGGLVTIAFNGQAAASRRQQEADNGDQLMESGMERSAEVDGDEGRSHAPSHGGGYPLGLAAAVAAGFFGGLVLAPMNFAEDDAKGLQYIPSMALGVLLAAPLVTAAVTAASNSPWSLYTATAAVPGIVSGAIWNAGNALSIVATRNPDVGLGVAYPIMQAGLFVAGLWGIFLFQELKLPREQVIYGIGGILVVAGATMLAMSK